MGSIWLTRPEADSRALAAELATHGIDSLIAPVMRIVPCTPTIDKTTRPDALLISSRHATHALATLPNDWRTLPVFCIGAATAEAARSAGYAHTTHGENDMLALLPRLVEAFPPSASVLYLAGEDTRIDAVSLLNAQHIHAEKVVVYKADAETILVDSFCESIRTGQVHGVSFFSPRSAQIAVQLLRTHGLAEQAQHIHAYCLSLAVAEAAGALPWKTLHACHLPTQAAMVDLIVSHSA
jgi:uroporphyrinogen-III synthase